MHCFGTVLNDELAKLLPVCNEAPPEQKLTLSGTLVFEKMELKTKTRYVLLPIQIDIKKK
jgi:hypothetical protein